MTILPTKVIEEIKSHFFARPEGLSQVALAIELECVATIAYLAGQHNAAREIARHCRIAETKWIKYAYPGAFKERDHGE